MFSKRYDRWKSLLNTYLEFVTTIITLTENISHDIVCVTHFDKILCL